MADVALLQKILERLQVVEQTTQSISAALQGGSGASESQAGKAEDPKSIRAYDAYVR